MFGYKFIKFYKIVFLIIIVFYISCKPNDAPKPKPKISLFPYDYYGFEGTVVDFLTNERIQGCSVMFFGKKLLLDTLRTLTDSNGNFRLVTSKGFGNDFFSLRITHPVYNVIINKTIYLHHGSFDSHCYIAYPPFWVRLHLVTLKNLDTIDYFGFRCDLMWNSKADDELEFRYGKQMQNFDTTVLLKGVLNRKYKDDGIFGIIEVSRNQIKINHPIYLPVKAFDTTEHFLIF